METPFQTAGFEVRESPTPLDDVGPDVSRTPEEPPKPQRKSRNKEKAENLLGQLGKNQPLRSGVRKLTDDDRAAIVAMYESIGSVSQPIRPTLSVAIELRKDACADAWMAVAEKNVKVRARLLAFLEGGEWTKLFFAHLPLFMAVIPESLLEKWLTGIGGLFGHIMSANIAPDDMAA